MSKIAAQKAIAEHLKKVEEEEGPPALSRRVFEKYDKDESGTIDRTEFKAMCYDLGYYLSEAETDIAFRTIDLSGNGDITYDEFYQAPHHHRTHRTPHTHTSHAADSFWRNDKRFENLHKNPAELQRLQAAVAYFQYFDQDKSGQLDKQEFASLHADLVKNNMTTHDLESCFEELDTDGSGTISFNEYVEWISCARVPKVKVLPPPSV